MVQRQLSATSVYAACSANRTSHAVDWAEVGGEATLVYASHRSIAISTDLNSDHPPPTHLLPTPRGSLTVLKYAHALANSSSPYDDPVILAGTSDGYLHLAVADRDDAQMCKWRLAKTWSNQDGVASLDEAEPSAVKPRSDTRINLKLESSIAKGAIQTSAPLRALGVLRPALSEEEQGTSGKYLFASAASDGIVRIWSLLQPEGRLDLLQKMSIGSIGPQARTEVLPLDITLVRVPGRQGHVLMAIAGTHAKIDLWMGSEKPSSFKPLFSLSGHSDWIRSLDFCTSSLSTSPRPSLMLASASQDNTVRLWRLHASAHEEKQKREDSSNLDKVGLEPDEFDRMALEIEGAQHKPEDQEEIRISTRSQTFYTDDNMRWEVKLDALLFGHEGWVTGLRWAPPDLKGKEQAAALVTSSVDNSIILWTPSSSLSSLLARGHTFPSFDKAEFDSALSKDDVWVAAHRFGELGGTGSANNGMYGVAWAPRSTTSKGWSAVVAHGYGGAIHLWSRGKGTEASSWEPKFAKGGHFASVSSVRWEPRGEYLISGGLDKTTRLHGRYSDRRPAPLWTRVEQRSRKRRDDNFRERSSWHEIARPQTHGYEIMGLSWLSRLSFASAGDEKVVRVFEAPQGFVDSAINLGTVAPSSSLKDGRNREVVVVMYLPTLDHLRRPCHLARPIREATLHACCCNPPPRVSLLAISPMFAQGSVNEGREEAPTLSFEDAETFLKWCYAQAWGVAVQRQRLQTDIGVLCMADRSAQDCLNEKIKSGIDSIWLIDGESKRTAPYFPLCFFSPTDKSEQTTEPSALPPANTIDITMLPQERTRGVLPSLASAAAGTLGKEPVEALPRYRNVALGGTFDHLHAGHKILLSMACLTATERIIVGVTDDSMLTKKKHAELLEPLDKRLKRVDDFLELFGRVLNPYAAVRREVVKLADVAGPAGTEEDLQALILTDETASGGDYIDKVRIERGFNKLARLTIGVLGSSGEMEVKGKDAAELAAAKVGSSSIREWLASNKTTRGRDAELDRDDFDEPDHSKRPVGASVPPLGLSNRAVFNATSDAVEEEAPSETGQMVGKSQRSISSRLIAPPTEETLHLSSLWSEVEKIYGHALELLSIDATDGLIVASANARVVEHAAVRVFDSTQRFKEVQVLVGHHLGATRVRFSPKKQGEQHLLTISRDRSWRLYTRAAAKDGDRGRKFELTQVQEEAHSRILYDAAWSLNGDMFATASRDKQVKLWKLHSYQEDCDEKRESRGKVQLAETIRLGHSVTALAFGEDYKLAIGLESGDVLIFSPGGRDSEFTNFQEALRLKQHHTGAVNELTWQPIQARELEPGKLLASAGADGAVRIVRID